MGNYATEVYKKYILSPKWQEKRLHIAEIRNYTCEKCHKVVKSGFHIHHKTYRHFKKERDNELMFLCEDCHHKIHYRPKKTIEMATCLNCLEKFNLTKWINNGSVCCPICNSFIGKVDKDRKNKKVEIEVINFVKESEHDKNVKKRRDKAKQLKQNRVRKRMQKRTSS